MKWVRKRKTNAIWFALWNLKKTKEKETHMHREELSCQRGSVGGWAGEISRILLIAVLEFLFHAGSGWGGNNRMNDSENAAGCSIRTHVPVPTSVFSNISWKLKASGNLLSYNFLIFWTLTLLTGPWHLTQGLNHDSPHMPVAPHPPHEIPAASVTGCGGGWEREVVCGLLLLGSSAFCICSICVFSPKAYTWETQALT